MKENPSVIQPVVCCVENRYIICIPAMEEALIAVLINGQRFTCDDNGVRKSSCQVHKIEVPMEILDQASGYTVEYVRMLDRRPYRSALAPAEFFHFAFHPVSDRLPIRIAHLSDVHGLGEAAIQTGSYFNSDLDLLILNGDISSSSNNMEEALLPLRIAYEITKGERPCVITRGNHDLRGKVAERLCEIYPTDHGRMYYTVRFPACRLLILDCGEDKVDSHVEYGETAAFHSYRLKETEFIRKLITDDAFLNESKPLILISHIPFPHTDGNGEFAIEESLYTEWCQMIKEYLRPDFCLFGHHHKIECLEPGDEFDTKQLQTPFVIGGMPVNGPIKDVYGAFLTVFDSNVYVVFSNRKHQIIKSVSIQTK